MKTFSQYQNDITGMKDVAATIKAIEKIAASHIHLLKRKVQTLDRTTHELENILSRLPLSYENKNNMRVQQQKPGKRALVIITGNKRLVGNLYTTIIDAVIHQKSKYSGYIAIGSVGAAFLETEQIHPIKVFSQVGITDPVTRIHELFNFIEWQFISKQFAHIDMVYPEFISLTAHTARFIQLLPFTAMPIFERSRAQPVGIPIFDSSKKQIVDWFLRSYIQLRFQKIIFEALLSEFSARTITSEHAANKTDKAVHILTHLFLKERKILLTQKQIESFVAHTIL